MYLVEKQKGGQMYTFLLFSNGVPFLYIIYLIITYLILCLNYSDSGNELPLSSIADYVHPINNLKIARSAVEKCKTADCQTKRIIEQDNKLPNPSRENFVHPIDNNKKMKCESGKCETVDYQIELDIDQDNELPLSSIADFLHPIDQKLKNSKLQKCETINNQTEENNNHNDELTLSSIAHSLHRFENKFIEHEAVDCQSNENINHYNKSEPNRLICNKEQSKIENVSKTYECDICGEIFSKRTDIIRHYKTSLCYPAIIYIFDSF